VFAIGDVSREEGRNGSLRAYSSVDSQFKRKEALKPITNNYSSLSFCSSGTQVKKVANSEVSYSDDCSVHFVSNTSSLSVHRLDSQGPSVVDSESSMKISSQAFKRIHPRKEEIENENPFAEMKL